MEQEQLTLNLQIRPAPSLDNFAVGDNAELVSVLRTMAETGSGPQFLYLWGETGVGCTHLLHAMDPLAGVERVPAFSESRLIYTVDDVEELGEDSQQKLFELMNDVRSHSDGGPFGQYRLITACISPNAPYSAASDEGKAGRDFTSFLGTRVSGASAHR